MPQITSLTHTTAPDEVRTEEHPAQEKSRFDEQDVHMLPAEQVYAERLNETRQDGDPAAPAFIP